MSKSGDLLRLARQFRGLTQKEAAPKLEVAQAVLSRLENDLIEIDDNLIRKASGAYNLPEEFFAATETVYGPPVSVHTMLRGKSDVSAREVDMITAELNIRLFHLRRFLENVDYKPTADFRILDVEQFDSVDQIAGLVRAHWQVTTGPIKNLTALVERAGIIVAFSGFKGSSVSGVTFRAPGNPPIILLNKHHPADRLRFTLAHELGHVIMHRFPTAIMEGEANEFASSFLLPPTEMKGVFLGRKITLELLAALKKEWRVSMQALIMSAQHTGSILPNQARYLFQQMSERGWRLREPAELDFAIEQPNVLASIIKTHTSYLRFNMSDFTRMTRVHESDFVNLYGNLPEEDAKKPQLRIVK